MIAANPVVFTGIVRFTFIDAAIRHTNAIIGAIVGVPAFDLTDICATDAIVAAILVQIAFDGTSVVAAHEISGAIVMIRAFGDALVIVADLWCITVAISAAFGLFYILAFATDTFSVIFAVVIRCAAIRFCGAFVFNTNLRIGTVIFGVTGMRRFTLPCIGIQILSIRARRLSRTTRAVVTSTNQARPYTCQTNQMFWFHRLYPVKVGAA